MEPIITLTSFEAGQLYVLLSGSNMGKLSPELRAKLKDAFKGERKSNLPDAFEYATDEPGE